MIVAPECASAPIWGPLQIEKPFLIPDTTQASFRDDMALPHDCVATDSDFAHSALVLQTIVGVRYFQQPRLRLRHRYSIRHIAGPLGLLPP